MPTLFEVLERQGTPLGRVETIMAGFDKVQLNAGVREHFTKQKDGSMKCGICGANCPHPRAAQAHMAERHMKELKACTIKSKMKAFSMKHRITSPSNLGNGKMGHHITSPSMRTHKTAKRSL